MPIAAGELDRRIRVLQPVAGTVNALNEASTSWPALLSCWAKVSPVRDGERAVERLASREVAAAIDTRFLIRWSAAARTITPLMRVEFGERLYDIRGVKEVGRREGIEISASARAETALP